MKSLNNPTNNFNNHQFIPQTQKPEILPQKQTQQKL